MASLVDSSHTQVETVDVAAGHGVGLNHTAIAVVSAGIGGAGANVRRQTARAEDAAAEVGHEVDVVSAVRAIAESVLHGGGIGGGTNSPGIVDGEGGGDAVELDVAACVGSVESDELVISHLLSDGAGLCGGGDDVESDIDNDGCGVAD
jgi:hypothetical protein